MKKQIPTSTGQLRAERPPGAGTLHRLFSAELPLHELRQTKALSQVNLAKTMHVHQAAISKMEHRTDMYISTLREYIRAMGGDLEIIARFPDGAVKISNFDDPVALNTVREPSAEGIPAHSLALA
jgi:DNA-binding XRE family transcriptional regulator